MPAPESQRDRRETQHVVTRVILPLAVTFCAAVLVVHQLGRPVSRLMGDPTATLHANPLLGFFSNVGILGWCAGASVAVFAAWVAARRRGPRAAVQFHAGAGAFTTLLLVDDFFLVHDSLAPRYLHLPQNAVYAVYALVFASFLIRCRREIMARNPMLFLLAVGLLGFMAGIDAVVPGHSPLLSLAMSGSKLLGIFAWSAWLILNARRDLESLTVIPVDDRR